MIIMSHILVNTLYNCITVREKTIEEFFTLCPGLLFLADLVFRLYYIVSQVAMPFLFIKIPKSDRKQSITERKSD